MAMESWRVTFLRTRILIRNFKITLTLKTLKQLMGEPDFFPDAQGFHGAASFPINRCGPAASVPYPAPRHAHDWSAAGWGQYPLPA